MRRRIPAITARELAEAALAAFAAWRAIGRPSSRWAIPVLADFEPG